MASGFHHLKSRTLQSCHNRSAMMSCFNFKFRSIQCEGCKQRTYTLG
ncbi:hypothetical protein C7S16_4299 [Burkholderia thailandensis]|uniref:Uncharacterized protein n=1 Tax=Burkholderia thailandensis TaxID=57975 RepID=A0AAW9CX61_BURTH|nr:hypothetical protein [Burkholderia thailandensis]